MNKLRTILSAAVPVLCLAMMLIGLFAMVQAPTASAHGRIPSDLVPCGRNIDGVAETTLPGEQSCTVCDLWHLSDHLINFLIFALMGPLVILAFMWGGFTYLTSGGDPKKVSQGTSIMTGAITGLVISLAAWLIVDTVIKTLANDEFSAAWNEIEECLPVKLPTVTNPGGVIISPTSRELFTTDAEARAFFQDAGIEIRSTGSCTDPAQRICTGVVGLPKTTGVKLLYMHQTLGERLILTGGTEVGHAEHGIGKPVVDIKPRNNSTAGYVKLRDAARAAGAVKAFCETPQGQSVSSCEGADHIHVVFTR